MIIAFQLLALSVPLITLAALAHSFLAARRYQLPQKVFISLFVLWLFVAWASIQLAIRFPDFV